MPIVPEEDAIGVISVQSTREGGRFGEADVRLLSTIAASVGVAIRNAQLYEETRRRGDEMAALAEVGRELSTAVDLAACVERIAERAQASARGRHERGLPGGTGEQEFSRHRGAR